MKSVTEKTILALSSEVLAGEVGLNIIRPTLRSLSINCIACPTVLLASHPGAFPQAPAPVGQPLPPPQINAMLDWLLDAGALDHVSGIITGYMPSAAHVEQAAACVDRLKKIAPDCLYLCDPICGDRGRLYIAENTAQAIRDHLLPRADIATPNLFELGWLTDTQPTDLNAAIRAAQQLPCREVIVTSAPAAPDHIATLYVAGHVAEPTTYFCETAKTPGHIHGMGDAFAALYLGRRLSADRPDHALAVATATAATMAQSAQNGQLASQPIALADPAATVSLAV
jgi:pyridoxine kinase